VHYLAEIPKTWNETTMSDNSAEKISRDDILRMAVDVVAAYVSKNPLPASQISEVIHTVYNSLNSLENRRHRYKE